MSFPKDLRTNFKMDWCDDDGDDDYFDYSDDGDEGLMFQSSYVQRYEYNIFENEKNK